MKKIISLILVMMFALVGMAMAEDKPVLVMGTNAEFPPYEYYEGTEIIGIDVEIAQTICDRLGYTLVVEDMAFDAVIPAVQSGKVDFGMSGMTITEDRQQFVNFSDPYTTAVQVVIVSEDSDITSVDDLFNGGYSIGVQLATTGDLYATWDLEDTGLCTVERYNKGADAVEALKAGKIDCVIIDNEPAKAFVAANEGLVILDTEYALEEYAIVFSFENEDLMDDFNAELATMKEDGTLDAINAKYLGDSEEAAEETDAE